MEKKEIEVCDALFYYTNFCALKNILENEELWLCNVRFMNDKKEMIYYMQELERNLLSDKNLDKKGKDKIQDIFAQELKEIDKHITYCMSFSKREDDAAQWERYAQGGNGVCIRFNREKLKIVCQFEAVLQTVFYEIDERKNKHIELLKKYLIEGIDETPEFGSLKSAFWNAWNVACAYKHKSFSCEEEIRLIARENFLKKVERKYKVEKSGIREYCTINLGEDGNHIEEIIEEIVIGPKCSVDVGLLERYLGNIDQKNEKRSVSKIVIKKSECPLR